MKGKYEESNHKSCRYEARKWQGKENLSVCMALYQIINMYILISNVISLLLWSVWIKCVVLREQINVEVRWLNMVIRLLQNDYHHYCYLQNNKRNAIHMYRDSVLIIYSCMYSTGRKQCFVNDNKKCPCCHSVSMTCIYCTV